MIRIVKRNGDNYTLSVNSRQIHGNIYRIVFIMRQLAISYLHIERGLVDLLLKEHDIAEYTSNGYYLGSHSF